MTTAGPAEDELQSGALLLLRNNCTAHDDGEQRAEDLQVLDGPASQLQWEQLWRSRGARRAAGPQRLDVGVVRVELHPELGR